MTSSVPLLALLEHFAEQAHTTLLLGGFGFLQPHLQARYLTGDHVENSVLHRQAQTTGSKVEDEGREAVLLVAVREAQGDPLHPQRARRRAGSRGGQNENGGETGKDSLPRHLQTRLQVRAIIWEHRGKQHKESFRTLPEAREAKGRRDAGEKRP